MSLSIREIFFLIIIFISNIVQTITGFAGTVLAMPGSLALVGYEVARPILNFIVIPISLVIMIIDFKHINWKALLFMVIFVGIGFAAGFGISFLPIERHILLIVYGSIISLVALAYMFFHLDTLVMPTWLTIVILILAGIIHFLYTSGGPLVIIFASHFAKEKKEFRGTLSAMWLLLNSIVFGGNLYNGYFTPHVWWITGLALITLGGSVFLGNLITKHLNHERFMKLTYILLFILGLSTVVLNIIQLVR